MKELEACKTHLQQELTHLGITATQESTEWVVKKNRVVGCVLTCSWKKQADVDLEYLLSIIARVGGYGAIRTDGEIMTIEVSISLN